MLKTKKGTLRVEELKLFGTKHSHLVVICFATES